MLQSPSKCLNTQESDYFERLKVFEDSDFKENFVNRQCVLRNKELESLRASPAKLDFKPRRSSIFDSSQSFLPRSSYIQPMKMQKLGSFDKIIKPLEFKHSAQSRAKHLQIQQLIKSIGRKY